MLPVVRSFDHAPEVYKQALEARFNSPMLKNLPPEKGKLAIRDIVLKMLFDSGQNKVSGNNDLEKQKEERKLQDAVVIMTKTLYNDIRNTFFNVTIQEIRIALETGLRGGYVAKTGNLFGGVTVVNCIHWIRSYLDSEKVLESIKHHLAPPPIIEPIDELVRKAGFEMLRKNFVEPILKAEVEKRKEAAKEMTLRSLNTEKTQDQKWLDQFDKIHYKQDLYVNDFSGARYIKRYKKKMTISDFLQHKANQYIFVKELLRGRK